MNSTPISIEDIDVNKLDIRPPKKEGSSKFGLKFHVFHDNARVRIVLPEMIAPFGGGASKDYPDSYNVGLSFEGMDQEDRRGERLRRAHAKFTEINDKLRELMIQKKDMIFPKDGKKKVENSVLASRYQNFIRSSETRPDLIYFRLQNRMIKDEDKAKMSDEEKELASKQFQPMLGFPHLLIDNDKKPIDITTENVRDVLPYGSRIKAIVELAYLWAKTDKLNPIWVLGTARRISTVNAQNFEIERDSDAEEEEEEVEEENEDAEMADEEDEAIASASR